MTDYTAQSMRLNQLEMFRAICQAFRDRVPLALAGRRWQLRQG
jgi:hypothetical protein